MHLKFISLVLCAIQSSSFKTLPIRYKINIVVSAQGSATNDFDLTTGKSVTKEIMAYFMGDRKLESDIKFRNRLSDIQVDTCLDGMHILTILFQCARSKRLAKSIISAKVMYNKLLNWNVVWSERDISTFVYGIKSLEGIDEDEGLLLLFGAEKIRESKAVLSSRSIGNALYGLQSFTSSTTGANDICEALAQKLAQFQGDLNGQDIGIGIYGLQGMSSDSPSLDQHILHVLHTPAIH
jgi:hypothetical protein